MMRNLCFHFHKKAVCVLMVATLLLTGCGSAIPELSEEENEMVSNYAANLLLIYGTNYDSRLVDTSVLPEDLLKLQKQWEAEDAAALAAQEKTPESTDLPDDMGQTGPALETAQNQEKTGENHTDLTTALKLPEGMSAEFAGYDMYQTYMGGEDNAFSLVASEGKQLLILQISFYNSSGADMELDFLDRFPNIIARTNKSHANSAQLTVLTNDLITYKGMVPAGSGTILCLVFEVTDAITSVDSLDLVVTMDSDVNSVTLF